MAAFILIFGTSVQVLAGDIQPKNQDSGVSANPAVTGGPSGVNANQAVVAGSNEMDGEGREALGNVLDNIVVHSYDHTADYMAKMYEASLDGSRFALEMGAIYEVQRNLKIEEGKLGAEPTYFFTKDRTAEQIQYDIELFLGIVKEPQEQLVEMSVPSSVNTSFKAYMDYRTITSTGSTQYQLQKIAYTENGFRKIDDCYLVAMGSYYGSCGDKLKITFDTGNSIYVILGDSKADGHTDSLHMYRPMKTGYGNVVEFIIDSKTVSPLAKKMGDVSHASDILKGNVAKIQKVV